MKAYPSQTWTCGTLWDSQSQPDVMQPEFEPGTAVMTLALRCSNLDRCDTQDWDRCATQEPYLTKKDSDGVLHQMTWPPQSPDLTPIDLGWVGPQSEGKAVKKCSAYVGTPSRAFQVKLVERMPIVFKAVIKAVATLKNLNYKMCWFGWSILVTTWLHVRNFTLLMSSLLF